MMIKLFVLLCVCTSYVLGGGQSFASKTSKKTQFAGTIQHPLLQQQKLATHQDKPLHQFSQKTSTQQQPLEQHRFSAPQQHKKVQQFSQKTIVQQHPLQQQKFSVDQPDQKIQQFSSQKTSAQQHPLQQHKLSVHQPDQKIQQFSSHKTSPQQKFTQQKLHEAPRQDLNMQFQQPIEQQQYSSFQQSSNFKQPSQQQFLAQSAPSPYAFSYEADGSSREESSDGSGTVTGTYTVLNEDGSKRLVKYLADDKGFHAQIDTDEPGTKSDSPANVQLKSSAKAPEFQQAPNRAQIFSSTLNQQKKFQAPISQQPITQFSQEQYSSQPASKKSSFSGQSSQGSSAGEYYGSYANQNNIEEQYGPAGPYEFNYVAQLEDGSSSRRESSDGSGTITGSYDLAVADGRKRTVEYIADHGGFRAVVKTNEFGTKSDSPADVMLYSTATDDEPAPYRSPVSSYQAQSFQAPITQKTISGNAVQFAQVHQGQSQSFQAPVAQKSVFSNAAPFVQSYQPQQQQQHQFNQAPLPLAEKPIPYSFNYQDQGHSSRSESADSSGKVSGSYSLTHTDGSQRVVEYTADENGFRANVKTNELGTKSDSPADVSFQSSAPLNVPVAPVQLSLSSPLNYKSSGAKFQAGNKFQGQQKVEFQSQLPAGSSFKSTPAVKSQSFQGIQQQIQQEPEQYEPAPYAFNYDAEGSARQESSDNSGKVTGSYSVKNEDGSSRVVDYVADKDGFRANVKTDEPGTKSDNPANVILQSSAPEPKPYFPPQQSVQQFQQQPIEQYQQSVQHFNQPAQHFNQPAQQQFQQQPIEQFHQENLDHQFPSRSHTQKTVMFSQEKVY